jgi:hypothetical protein
MSATNNLPTLSLEAAKIAAAAAEEKAKELGIGTWEINIYLVNNRIYPDILSIIFILPNHFPIPYNPNHVTNTPNPKTFIDEAITQTPTNTMSQIST